MILNQSTCPQIDYILHAAPKLVLGQTLTVTGTINASSDAVFNYLTQSGSGGDGNGPGHAAACRPFIEQINDDLTKPTYRWWASDPADIVLQNGPFSVSVALDPAKWTDVNGQQDAAGFAAAVAGAAKWGLTCGGGFFYGHGVNMAQGSASLNVASFSVQ